MLTCPAQLESTDKTSIQERKIRVTWITEGQSSPAVAATPSRHSALADATNDTPDVTRTFSSPGQEEVTSGSPPPYSSKAATRDDSSDHDQSTVSAATAAVTQTAQLTYDEIKAKLAQAENKIISLQNESGLRQRVKAETEKLPTAQEASQAVRQSVEGVSVQMVAFLCLLSFLLAYFFF